MSETDASVPDASLPVVSSSPSPNSGTRLDATHASRYWSMPLLRTVPAAAVALVITFSADHSPTLGFVCFGAFAVVSGVILIVGSLRMLDPGVVRGLFLAQGSLAVASGVVSLLSTSAGLPFLLFLISAYAAFTGFLELYAGLRSRGVLASSRDWVFVGALTAVLAVGTLLVPAGFAQQFTGPDGVQRELTASVIIVGLFGAYAALLSVYFVIAGLSLRWSTAQPSVATAGSN